jgi:hypothetical protein
MSECLVAFILIVISIQSTFAQKVWFEKELKLRRGLKEKREAYPVTNPFDQNTSLFLIDNSTIKAYLFNNVMQIADTVEGPRPESRYSELLGSNFSNGKYNLFFSTASHKSLAIASIDYSGKTVRQSLVELAMKKELYAGSASHQGKFYIFTVAKASTSSILNLYVFGNNAEYELHTYDFNQARFSSQLEFGIVYVIKRNELVFIDNDVPNAIDLVNKPNKVYAFDDKMVLTFDELEKNTGVITIDLKTFAASELKNYPHKHQECSGSGVVVSSNSYIYKRKLYQLSVCADAMKFKISDFPGGEVLGEFNALREGEIAFRNSPILQEKGGSFGMEERELSKTRQFLRKVSSSDAGISAYESSGGIEVSLGGSKMVQAGGSGAPGMSMGSSTISTPGGPVVIPSYNPAFTSYNSYKYAKSVRFKSLLDPVNYNHRQGNVGDNVFDKIRDFTEKIDGEITAETVFKRQNVFLFGYYYKPERKYVIRIFTD